MLAVGGAEGVVDVEVAELGELCGESRVVLFFFLVEAGIFQQQHVAIFHSGDGLGRPRGRCSRRRESRLFQELPTSGVAAGLRENFFSGPPLGRPRWVIKIARPRDR